MLSGSASLRVIVLLLAAAVLAGIVQHYLSQPGEVSEPPRSEAKQAAPGAPAAPKESAVQDLTAEGASAGGTAAGRPPSSPPSTPPRPAPEPMPAAPPAPAPAMAPDETPDTPSEPQRDQALAPAPGNDTAEPGEATGISPNEPREENAGELVDLNTATLAQLNGLRGGGAIGRAIIQRRPYASVDQLLSKRVLSRSTFQKIKDQVTVR